MIVVTGATGNVGAKLTEQLLKEGKKVKAVARNRDKLKGLAAKGAEIAEGSLEDAAFLARAFAGAESVFALVPANLQAQDIQAYYDKIGDATAKALRESGVRSVVHLSSRGAHLASGNGPIAGLYRQEQRLNALPGVDVLHLRAAYFMENLLGSAGMVKQMGILGSATRGDLKMQMIATQDIARHAAGRLAKKDFSGKTAQDLLGPRDVTMNEVAAVLGKAIGKPDLRYVQFPYPDFVQGLIGAGFSKSVAESFAEMSKAMNENQFGEAKRDAASNTPTSIEEFAPIFASVYKGM
jgi:uncharacterized protein YbjT (DUF2867 family)